jgi:hypothetical protein
MAKDKRTIGEDVSEEVVNAFEAGIVFGEWWKVEGQSATRCGQMTNGFKP